MGFSVFEFRNFDRLPNLFGADPHKTWQAGSYRHQSNSQIASKLESKTHFSFQLLSLTTPQLDKSQDTGKKELYQTCIRVQSPGPSQGLGSLRFPDWHLVVPVQASHWEAASKPLVEGCTRCNSYKQIQSSHGSGVFSVPDRDHSKNKLFAHCWTFWLGLQS